MADLRATAATAHRLVARYRRALSAFLAGLAAFGVVQVVTPTTAPAQAVVVAAADLTAGTLLSSADVRTVRLPAAGVPAGSASTERAVLGRMLAAPVRTGEVITDVRLVGPSLVRAYPPGTVAAPVRLADAAVVRLLRVGDHVDVYAVRSDRAPAQVVVDNVVVVALPPNDDDSDQGRLIVLAVTSPQAAALAEASGTAPLTLVMRR